MLINREGRLESYLTIFAIVEFKSKIRTSKSSTLFATCFRLTAVNQAVDEFLFEFVSSGSFVLIPDPKESLRPCQYVTQRELDAKSKLYKCRRKNKLR